MVKFTKTEIYETIIALVTGKTVPTFEKKDGEKTIMTEVSTNDIVERMKKDIEMLKKKSSKSEKMTKTQEQNVVLKEKMVSAMTDQPAKTIDEIKTICPEIKDLSTSKISALLSQLRENNIVERTYVKKKAYFKVK